MVWIWVAPFFQVTSTPGNKLHATTHAERVLIASLGPRGLWGGTNAAFMIDR